MRKLTDPEEMAELARLYDIYGELIKGSHRDIFEEYILENYSLSEIASSRDVTRQAVYDSINRTRGKLRQYEDKLALLERATRIEDGLMRIESLCGSKNQEIKNIVDELKSCI